MGWDQMARGTIHSGMNRVAQHTRQDTNGVVGSDPNFDCCDHDSSCCSITCRRCSFRDTRCRDRSCGVADLRHCLPILTNWLLKNAVAACPLYIQTLIDYFCCCFATWMRKQNTSSLHARAHTHHMHAQTQWN